jgi:glycosyltransferase involved in cell wall biosynthesis
MSLDWNSRLKMRDQNIIYHSSSLKEIPRVTIGLPTYRREKYIRRALASIASQTYRNFELIISDNAGCNPDTLSAVEEFSESLPDVTIIAQPENIGAINNLKFLLALAETEYFMWLADDDEISEDYIEDLISLLDKDSSVVTAMGDWIGMIDSFSGHKRRQLRPVERFRLVRLCRFVIGPSDDSAYYGLHRTDCLRRSSFSDYLPPNRGVLSNFCYIILFDMLLQGRFEYGKRAQWICHNYSEKQYCMACSRGWIDRIRTVLRRLNVYSLYVLHAFRSDPSLFPFVLIASIIGFFNDLRLAFLRILPRFKC